LPPEEFVDFLSTYDTEKWWKKQELEEGKDAPEQDEEDFPSLDDFISKESAFNYGEITSLK